MTYRLKDDGRNLIPIREIESQILCDDPKAAGVFRNFLLKDLTSGTINPRNEYGFEVELGSLSRVTEIAVEKLADSILRESKPRSIVDIVITPAEAKKLAREHLEKDAKLNEKEFVLMGYLTKEDVTSFLAGHRIACEWLLPEGATENTATTIEQAAEPQSTTEIANAAQSDSLSTFPRIAIRDTKRTRTKQVDQQNEIVKIVKDLGYDPLKLPKQRNGLSGVRNEVFKELKIAEGELFGSLKTFDIAWSNCLKMGDLKYAS
jgi:hypothetical protein